MNKLEIETTIKFDIFSRDWSLLIIDKSRPGTHDTYNVIFNSGCIGISYKRKGIARAEAQKIIKAYKDENRT